jgi:hypothetical protein
MNDEQLRLPGGSIGRVRADAPDSAHAVPRAGTLQQISYCARCGCAFDSLERECQPDGLEPLRRDPSRWRELEQTLIGRAMATTQPRSRK